MNVCWCPRRREEVTRSSETAVSRVNPTTSGYRELNSGPLKEQKYSYLTAEGLSRRCKLIPLR